MTLGSIFSKLSGIKLRSIAKWYGIAVMSVVLLVFFIFFATAVGSIVIQIATALGFWGTLIVVGVALAVFCVNHFWDEIFPDEDDVWERHMRHTMLHGTEYKAETYNFRTPDVSEWNEIRHKILEMGDVDTITIFYKGEPFEFKNRSDALSFVDKIEAEAKTE